MKRIYNWVKSNKMVSGVVGATVLLIGLNLVLMAQFISILNAYIG